MAHTLFHDVGVETLYTGYSIGYTVRPMHILFRPCGLTLNKRNDRQRSPTAIMQTNSSMRMRRVRINVMGGVLSSTIDVNGLVGVACVNPLHKKISRPGHWPDHIVIPQKQQYYYCVRILMSRDCLVVMFTNTWIFNVCVKSSMDKKYV